MKLTLETEDLDSIQRILSVFAPLPTPIRISSPGGGGNIAKRQHTQGVYVGLVRHLSKTKQARVKALYKKRGVEAAIALARDLMPEPRKRKSKSSTYKPRPRHRTKCQECRKGFLARRGARFCSKRCRDAHRRRLQSRLQPKPTPRKRGTTILPGDPLTPSLPTANL